MKNSKIDYAEIERFIIEAADKKYLSECAGVDIKTEKDLFECIRHCFLSEKVCPYNAKGNRQELFGEYLSGLPTWSNIPFYNGDILELAEKWGSIPKDASERQQEKILLNYWSFMAHQYYKAGNKRGVNIYF